MSYRSVEHPAAEENTGNVDQVVGTTTNTSSQGSETNGGRLTNDDPRGRRRSQGEQDGDDETERGLCQGGRIRRAEGGGNTEADQEADVDEGTPDVDGSSAEVGRQDPRKHDKDHLQCRGDETQSKRQVGFNTSLCIVSAHGLTDIGI